MVLPTFIGLGTVKSGSSWFYEVIKSHPDICMAKRRKEVMYFNHNYDKAVSWYEDFFNHKKNGCVHIGEFSSNYFQNYNVPSRVKEVYGDKHPKFIVILRDPVKRLYSNYKYMVQNGEFDGSFSKFLYDNPDSKQVGLYSLQLQQWLKYFEYDNFFICTLKECIFDYDRVFDELAAFLGVSNKFDKSLIHKKTNKSFKPRFKKLYYYFNKLSRYLRKHDFDFIPNIAKQVGVLSLFATNKSIDNVDDDKLLNRLYEYYKYDISELERMTGKKLDYWSNKY